MIVPQPDPTVGVGMAMALLLAAVFTTAAITKLVAAATTSSELAGLGVPAARLVARLLPPLELAIAGALVLVPRVGGIAALAALTAFTLVLVRALRRGSTVSCGCLGASGREPISTATLARNGVMLAMAGAALVVPEPVVPDLASVFAAVSMLCIAVVAVQLVSLRQRIGRVWSVTLAGEGGADNGGTRSVRSRRGGR